MAPISVEPGDSAEHDAPALTYVAVGASAGGLEALRELFAAAAPDEQLAYIVITHLPIDHVSHLADLLGRAGPVPTTDAVNGERLRGGRVYVMPPGKLMALHEGKVWFERAPHQHRPTPKPIDFFMTSMAEDAGDRCVGVVLSGSDHDGTVGLKAIQAVGGLAIVQTPATAEFPGMPNSAISAGAADLVLNPAAVPSALSDFLGAQSAQRELGAAVPASSETDPSVLREILELVLTRTGNDFRQYRPGMLQRRLKRRMSVTHCAHVADYVALLNESPHEASTLSSEFLIGVTDFFRDPELWLELERAVLPPLIAQLPREDATFRVWTPACSSGEESYSIAMVVLELFDRFQVDGFAQVFGTDIDGDALAAARQGLYHDSITSTVTAERLGKFFERRRGMFAIRKRLRDAVTFAPQNLVQDTPFSKLDLICCRNLLMYFEPGLQDRVFQLFHFALKPDGLLWLGKAESLGAAHEALFAPVPGPMRLFRRIGGRSRLPRGFSHKASSTDAMWMRGAAPRQPSIAEILRDHLGARKVTAAVLTDREGRALHFLGETARFLEPEGDATLELLRLLRKELRPSARIVLRQATERDGVASRSVALPTRRDPSIRQHVDLQAERIARADAHGMVLVTFTVAQMGLAVAHEGDPPMRLLEIEMQENRQELALALEDAERTNEQLRIANEEASALYEEVQSSNEELESSKEELQALNEELSTVNAQLEDKIIETTHNADDLRNLLDSTHIATLLLDPELRLRRFTPLAGEFFRLRAGDEGRLLSDIAATVHDVSLFADAQMVLNTGKPAEVEVAGLETTVWLRRILPYVGHHGRTEGVVVTFVDVTVLRAAARQVGQLTAILDDSNDAVYSCDLNGRILSWNKGAERIYGYRREEALRMSVTDLSPATESAGQTGANALVHGIHPGSLGPVDAERRTKQGQLATVSISATALHDDQGVVHAMLFTERDISERLRVESEIRFRRLADDIPALLRVEDADGLTEFVNRGCIEFTGRSGEMLVGKGWLEFLHPQDRSRYLDEYAGAQAEHRQLDSDIRLQRQDGSYRWMRSMSVPHVDASGAFAGYVALMVDVEDRKQAELQLVEADHRKDEFLAMLAHELRNPLAPIRSAVTILSRSGLPDARAEWAVGMIDRQAELMAKLLDGLLDVARISRGKMTLDLGPVELMVVIQRAVEISQALITTRQQDLVVQMEDDVMVEGDLLRLTQVFANLLNNASKYTDKEGSIAVRVWLDGDQVSVRIEDNGAGISEEMLPRVFELFSQADTTLDRSKGGLGLGLTLVQQLVQLHGGTVRAESAGLAMGSAFTVRLPVLRVKSPAADAQNPQHAHPGGAARRVLVVDDNVDGAQSLAAVMEMEGHAVCIAYDGPQALQQATQWQPDVVLLDIGLPGMNGYQVARALRGAAATSNVTLIALTGYGQPEDVERALAAGFDRHLVKPIDLDVVIDLVAQAPRLPHAGRLPGES